MDTDYATNSSQLGHMRASSIRALQDTPAALDKAWAEAARRCRLSPADVRMAKELGFKPRSLLKNQPSPQQPWKAPVAEWVRDLYAKRQRRSEQRRQRRERAQEAMVDLTNADPSVATPTTPADI